MRNPSLKHTTTEGFSLVEMLVVLAAIGVMAAIAIPQIGSVKETKNQRNAQSIVSVYSAATAAGATVAGETAAAKVDTLVTGVAPTEGIFKDKPFKMPGLEPQDKTGALKYIKLESGELVYTKEAE
jgi:type IV pilus assembly protein PilA